MEADEDKFRYNNVETAEKTVPILLATALLLELLQSSRLKLFMPDANNVI